MATSGQTLVGIGLYTPAEAGRLINVSPSKLARWLKGHEAAGERYSPLWKPKIDLGDDKTYLSFRDLLEARTVAVLISQGLSAQRVRAAITLASEIVGDHPLSTTWLRTDGRTVFLKLIEEGVDQPRVIDLFKRQYAFSSVIEPSFRDVEFEGIAPKLWWPRGRRSGIVVDPARSFGQPIESSTSIPAQVLANAAVAEGGLQRAAAVWNVPLSAVRRAVAFQRGVEQTRAA